MYIFKGCGRWPSHLKKTLLEIQEILRKESQQSALPLSLAEIGRRMAAKKTHHETIRVAVQALEDWGAVALGSKGVIYTKAPAAVVRRKCKEDPAPEDEPLL